MELNTSRFGIVDINEKSILYFKDGLPGLEYLKKYVVIRDEETWPIYFLQSVDEAGIALPVINSFEVLEDYTLDINDDEVAQLKLEHSEDLIVLNVVVVTEKMEQMTANLAAPILINSKDCLGKQILIDNSGYPIRYPVYQLVMKAVEGVKANAGSVSKSE